MQQCRRVQWKGFTTVITMQRRAVALAISTHTTMQSYSKRRSLVLAIRHYKCFVRPVNILGFDALNATQKTSAICKVQFLKKSRKTGQNGNFWPI